MVKKEFELLFIKQICFFWVLSIQSFLSQYSSDSVGIGNQLFKVFIVFFF